MLWGMSEPWDFVPPPGENIPLEFNQQSSFAMLNSRSLAMGHYTNQRGSARYSPAH